MLKHYPYRQLTLQGKIQQSVRRSTVSCCVRPLLVIHPPITALSPLFFPLELIYYSVSA